MRALDVFWDLLLEGHVHRMRAHVKRVTISLQDLYNEIDAGKMAENGPKQKALESRSAALIAELERWDPYSPKNFTAKISVSMDELLALEVAMTRLDKSVRMERLRKKLAEAKASLADYLYVDSVSRQG